MILLVCIRCSIGVRPYGDGHRVSSGVQGFIVNRNTSPEDDPQPPRLQEATLWSPSPPPILLIWNITTKLLTSKLCLRDNMLY
ncbi:hypothetical protein HW555_000193 [Spodoptera exigua]|uniref:Uncharacterized protein n=1 Tax=Spodoptera exigua TaxID=7107 RepID=A0A835GV24_SPOEX|nr:hypothetical protein HW555_000193 [Spodoptera exigua]